MMGQIQQQRQRILFVVLRRSNSYTRGIYSSITNLCQQQTNVIPLRQYGGRYRQHQRQRLTSTVVAGMGVATAATLVGLTMPVTSTKSNDNDTSEYFSNILNLYSSPFKAQCDNNNTSSMFDRHNKCQNTINPNKVEIDENGLPNFGSSSDPFLAVGGIPFGQMIGSEIGPDDDPKDGRLNLYVYLKPIEAPHSRKTFEPSDNNETTNRSNLNSKQHPTIPLEKESSNIDSDYNKSLRAFERISQTRFFRNQVTREDSMDEEASAVDEQEQIDESSPLSAVVATSINRDNRHVTHLVPSFENQLFKEPSTETTPIQYQRKTHKGTPTVMTEKTYFANHPRVESSWLVKKLVLLGGPTSEELCWDVAQLLGIQQPHQMDVGQFNDGETRVQIQESVRGKHVYIIQSTRSTDAVMELLLLISTLRRASARKITAIIPYYGYGRQDKRTKRETIAAADIALLLEVMGVDQVICMDLHNDAVRGFFAPTVPVEHLMPVPVAAAYFHEEFTRIAAKNKSTYPKVTVVAAHEGQVGRATQLQSVLRSLSGHNPDLAVLSKTRILPGETLYEPKLVGNVTGRTCIIVDDIVSTGTTLRSNVQMLQKLNAHSIYGWATHGVFSLNTATESNNNNTNNDKSKSTTTKATSNNNNSKELAKTVPEQIQQLDGLEYLLISNSVMNEMELPSKIRLLNIAPLIAEAIARTLEGKSIDSIYDIDCTKTSTAAESSSSSTTPQEYELPERYDND